MGGAQFTMDRQQTVASNSAPEGDTIVPDQVLTYKRWLMEQCNDAAAKAGRAPPTRYASRWVAHAALMH